MKKLFGGNKKKEKEGTLVGKVVVVGPFSVRVEAVVGEGGFATIYRCTDIKTGLAYALKHMRLAPDTVDEVKAEAKVMARLKGHPNILRLHAVAFGGPTGAETDGFMLLDFCPLTLLEVMQRGNFMLDDFLVYEVFQDVVWAVAHMHKCNPPLAHRDLKAENVLKNGEGRWVICDFGSATSRAQVYDSAADIAAEEDVIRRTTTPAYRAPEMWDLYTRQRIDTAVDVWALGVLLYVLAFGKLPFPGDSKLAILYGKYEMPPGRPAAMRALIQDMLQVNPADRPDIFLIISKLDLLRNVLTSEASGGSNSGTPAAAAVAAAAGADGHPAAAAAPHPHPYPAPVPVPGAPSSHVLPGQQLPYPRQGSMGGPAPGPPGPMPPHPQQHPGVPVPGGAPPPPGWVPPGPPGAHHPPPPYHPGQGPPAGPPVPHGAPHPPAYAQPRPGGGPPPPQQVQRQPSRGGSFNPAWPAAGGPPGAPGVPLGAPGPQGAHMHPQGPPPPHLQQPHPLAHPQQQQQQHPYPHQPQPHPAAAQPHHAAPQMPPALPQHPQPQPQLDLLGDVCPDPPVTSRPQPDRRTSGCGRHAAAGFGDDADWAGASAAFTSAPATADAAPGNGAARASGSGAAAAAHAGAAPGDVDWGEQPAFETAHSVATTATPAPTPSGGVSHLHQPKQVHHVQAQRAASQAAPGDLMSLDSILPATPPPSFSQPAKAQSGPPQPAVAALAPAPAAALAPAAPAAAQQEPPPALSGLSPMSSHANGVSGANSSAPNSKNMAATAAVALQQQQQQPAVPAAAPSPVLVTPAAWSPLEGSPGQAGGHSDAAAGLRPASGAGTGAVAMLTPAGPDGSDAASLRAEVSRLAAANAALEGRVRQLEGLVSAQGSALQRLTADLAAVQQPQHHSHLQHHHANHHHGGGSASSSFGGTAAAAAAVLPATVSRLAPHSGASARLPGSGGATGGTGGGNGHPGLLLTSGGAAGGGTGGSSFTSGAFTSGPGGGGGPGGNQLLAGMGSGPAEEGAASGRLAANGGVAAAGAGAAGAAGAVAFPVEDGFGEGSPWMPEHPPSGSAPYPPIGYEDLT
ncbi:hypothetical protein HYH02_004992 [Chlamydomonas schloesseri]|uniref:non-specific serine/threonine protein kinase n=1 Tax=Chlamydomonas schloesseri TaxID=2026947 RepID=A0A835WN34_9CHLO|nr:hypothetical protein HYH02_004992 [Chlamydomonas schloesseri]|eukprot:KAG2450491.1 hypothetical protein HYH02_004992 [Chlamydomonas schloesseri]